jgi:hypothetical protein
MVQIKSEKEKGIKEIKEASPTLVLPLTGPAQPKTASSIWSFLLVQEHAVA